MLFKLANDWSADRCWPTWFDHLYLISFFFVVIIVFFLFEWDWLRWFDHWELSNNGNNRRKWWCLSVFIILRFTYFCLFSLSLSLFHFNIMHQLQYKESTFSTWFNGKQVFCLFSFLFLSSSPVSTQISMTWRVLVFSLSLSFCILLLYICVCV